VSFLEIYGPILLAALLGGGSAGAIGVYVVGMRMPFIAVVMAHAAMAGAIVGTLTGTSSTIWAFGGALAAALGLGYALKGRTVDPNLALGSLFSLMMGISFLGIGLVKGPKTEVLGLLWGSILFVDTTGLWTMAGMCLVLLIFIAFFEKELAVILFSRSLASLYISEALIFAGLLVLEAGVITVNLKTVGGLLLFSLIANPAAAALRLARSIRGALLLATILGALSAVGGFLAAYLFDLPVGACIVLTSSAILALAVVLSAQGRRCHA